MNPQVLEIPGAILLTVGGYAIWRKRQTGKQSGRRADGRRREIWDEVEGRVTSVSVRGEAVYVGYEFLTPRGSQQAEHCFKLEPAEPYRFGSREADLTHLAERYLRAYQVASSARVRYNPKKVTESVLTRPRPQAAPAPSKIAESQAI